MVPKYYTKETEPFVIEASDILDFNLDDSDYFKNIAHKISMETGVPETLIYKEPYLFYLNRWFKVDGEWYFYKNGSYVFASMNELLGEVVSKYFDLDTAHYQPAILNISGEKEEYGIATKNFCNPKYTYHTCFDYNLPSFNGLSVFDDIRELCKTEEEYNILVEDLKKFFIRDFYTSQGDRRGVNFLFQETEAGIRLAPLYDYERSFDDLMIHCYQNQIASISLTSSQIKNILKQDDKFQELLEMIIKADMTSFIERVEEEHHIKIDNHYRSLYENHDKKMKKLLIKNQLV